MLDVETFTYSTAGLVDHINSKVRDDLLGDSMQPYHLYEDVDESSIDEAFH